MNQLEGIIKFKQDFKKNSSLKLEQLKELNLWRNILYDAGLIGQDPLRYCGAGYGNISQRLEPLDLPTNKRRFVITGSQTGHLSRLTEKDYTVVNSYSPEQNFISAEGEILASSESMTHGVIYDLDDSARFVFHSHSPQIWRHSTNLEIPFTKTTVEYGTPEMADEVRRLFKDTKVKDMKIFSMGGHEDGIITFGRTSEEAGLTMLKYLAKSLQLEL